MKKEKSAKHDQTLHLSGIVICALTRRKPQSIHVTTICCTICHTVHMYNNRTAKDDIKFLCSHDIHAFVPAVLKQLYYTVINWDY